METIFDNTKTILKLIEDDLKNLKLINGLASTGIDVSLYELKLQESIFDLLKLNSRIDLEEIKDWYFRRTEEVYKIDVSNSKELEKMALGILSGLMTR